PFLFLLFLYCNSSISLTCKQVNTFLNSFFCGVSFLLYLYYNMSVFQMQYFFKFFFLWCFFLAVPLLYHVCFLFAILFLILFFVLLFSCFTFIISSFFFYCNTFLNSFFCSVFFLL